MRLRSYASFAFASYYASNTARRTRIIAAGLYACFLLISVIPEFIDVTTDAFGYFSSDPYRDWPLLFFFYGHALFIQPIITALTTTSLLFQVHEIIIFADTRSALSLSWLALQAVTFAVLGFSWFGHINFDDDDDAETFLDCPDWVNFTIKRDKRDDEDDTPCTLKWKAEEDAWNPADVILRHHSQDGKVEDIIVYDNDQSLEYDKEKKEENVLHVVREENYGIFEIKPGEEVGFRASLPPCYRLQMVTGERYELFWPGGKIKHWTWGSLEENLGRSSISRLQKIEVPSPPSLPPETEADRVAGVPLLSMELSINGAPEIRKVNRTHSLDVNINSSLQALRLDQFNKTKHTWDLVDTGAICYGVGDLPDIQVNVTPHRDFVCLKPGKTWTTTFTVWDIEYGFSHELVTRDMLRLWFKGCTASW
ncbi:hypothetical protein BDV19DRAFT_388547 [Aspergillus venezuelensis]